LSPIVYHLPNGQVAGCNLVFIYIKHPHFLQVEVNSTNSGQDLQILNLRSASSGVALGVPLIKSQGFTSSDIYSPSKELMDSWDIQMYYKMLPRHIEKNQNYL
jgi:hypothetical protein